MMKNYKLKRPKGLESTVLAAYRKIETGVVRTYQKIERKFVDTFLEKTDGSEPPETF